ncbi:anti-sigma factor family protein [Neorhodopirellula lusitana]|uniref:anti-sigma factor family protein n=1 Tax=Neorhodopirellula lusitana TaxID=445327 RepID=UPI003850F419
MSVPTPNIDQLLSDHLDGWLEGEDLEFIEAQLRDDPAILAQYQSMLADRELLRAAFRQAKPATGLPKDFAAQVVAQANRRRAGEASSVEVASAAPINVTESSSNWNKTFLVSVVVATAAALLLMATLATRDTATAPSLAQNEPESIENRDLESPRLAVSEPIAAQPSLDTFASEPKIAELKIAEPQIADPKTTGAQNGAGVESFADMQRSADMPVEAAPPGTAPELAQIASASVPETAAFPTPQLQSAVSVSQPEDRSFAGAVLVYDIQLTTAGRVGRAVSRAMKSVGMAETSRQPIDQALVQAAESVESLDGESKFQILYLRASAKKLDRLFETLLNDSEGVDSVGLSLVTDSPILKLTDNLEKVDPTEVQHGDLVAASNADQRAVSFDLQSGQNDELSVLRRLLDDKTFVPMTRKSKPTSTATAGSGRDVLSRVLVIIR